MKRIPFAVLVGVMLLLGGGLLLLQAMGLISHASDWIWAAMFVVGGLIFGAWMITGAWWAAFPAAALIGIGAAIAVGIFNVDWGGAAFLAILSLGFWWVYLTDRSSRWWAIIPGGVLVTLAMVTLVDNSGLESGGVFFLGLAGTFALVGLLAKANWAYIPAAVLAVLGMILMASMQSFVTYIFAGALMLIGLYMVVRFFIKREE
jgi:hypothetical protein